MISSPVKSVILLSGGLDSAVNLAFCSRKDEPILAITADYGQRAAVREIEAARALARHYGVRHEVLDLRWLGGLGGSALTSNENAIPELSDDQLDDASVTVGSAKAVWVPNRNGVLINVAAAWAERLDAKRVIVGFNREEASTFPDNSTEFLEQASRALAYSTAIGVEVFCYTDRMDKREMVRAVRELDPAFPVDRIWSCYHPGGSTGAAVRCGRCESCRRFERALS